VPADGGKCGGRCKLVVRDPGAVQEAWFADRQRTGLVEHDGIDFGQPLEPVGGLQDHALVEQPARRSNLHGGNREGQRARASDDQHRDCGGERVLPDVSGQHPADERGGAEEVH